MDITRHPRLSGPPLALQILGLLLGGLVVAQLVTLFLTMILPPDPQPQYGLDVIARALSGAAIDSGDERPLKRDVQAGPPALNGPGWLISERSREDLARMLGRDPNDVRLYFYTPLPFAGTASVPQREVQFTPPPLPPFTRQAAAQRPRLPPGFMFADYQVAQLDPGAARFPGGGFPGGFPGGGFPGGSVPGGNMPGAGGPGGRFPGGAMTPGPNRMPSSMPQTGRLPQSPTNPGAGPAAGRIPGGTPNAPGPGAARPGEGLNPVPDAGAARGAMFIRPEMHVVPASPMLVAPDLPPPVTNIAPSPSKNASQAPRATPAPLPRESAAGDKVQATRPPTALTAAPPVAEQPATVTPAPPAPTKPARQAAPEMAIPIIPPPRGLFGLAPAPFVQGDFVAALRLPDGAWAVVQPTPEPFPNSWQRRLLIWFLLSFALVAPLGWIFARRLVRPIAGFAYAAEQLGRDPTASIAMIEGPAEVGRAAHAFNRMQSRLRNFVDDRTAMVGAISHDLRTPLTRLRFRIEDVPDDLRENMLAEVDEMEQMISSVLAFIRDASEPGMREMLDLRSILEDVVEDAVYVGKQVTLEGGERADVEVDPLGMRRLLGNLVENAVKYGDVARVRIFTDHQDAVAEIRDNGPGLPDDELERVFQPFYRAPAARASNKHGTGLGLAVCRSIARAHGGDVQLKRGDQGLIAQLRLPLAYGANAV
jgi:signal transduction histidine kinase